MANRLTHPSCCGRRMAVARHSTRALVLLCHGCGFSVVLLRRPARLRRAS